MITYREYLENLIIENTEDPDDINTLMEVMESAETVYELEAIETFLEEAKADDMTLKEQQDASGASTASDDGKINNNEYELAGYESAEKKLEKGIEEIEDGNIEKGAEIVGEAVSDALKIYLKATKEFLEENDISKEDIDAIKEDVNELKSKCKSGDITASEAKTGANKLRVKIKLIGKKIRSGLSKLRKNSKATTESALAAIFEGTCDGTLQDDDLIVLTEGLSTDDILNAELLGLLLEAKDAESDEEKESLRKKAFSKVRGAVNTVQKKTFGTYYGTVDKVADKVARKVTPTADNVATKQGRIANNGDYDDYYHNYHKTKNAVKAAAIAGTVGAISALPLIGVTVVGPAFANGAKYSPSPDDAVLVNKAIDTLKKTASSLRLKKKKVPEAEVNGALVAGNNMKAAINAGKIPDKKDIRLFDSVANKLNAMLKKTTPQQVTESRRCSLDDIKLLLEGAMIDDDLDSAIDTMTVVIEAYDFMDDEINDIFDTAEAAIDMRL